MRKKAEYRSAIRSREMIQKAFLGLLLEKEIEKISVTDIVNRANLNRGTFYAHYKYPRAVLEQIESEIIDKMLEFLNELNYTNFFHNPMPLLLRVASHLEDNLDFYQTLLKTKGSEQFLAKLKVIFAEHMENDAKIPESIKKTPEFNTRAHFFAGGIVNLYQAWFRGDTNQSLEEITLAISKIVIGSSSIFIEQFTKESSKLNRKKS